MIFYFSWVLQFFSWYKKSPDIIHGDQWRKLQKTLWYAYECVPFYRKKFDHAGIHPRDIKTPADLEKIPVATKEELRNAKEKIFAKGFSPLNTYSSKTSGSTGEPFISYFNITAWFLLKYLSKYRARRACGVSLFSRMVNIEACDQTKADTLNSKLILFPRLKYASLFSDIGEHVKLFLSFRPHVLYGMPSYFLKLGEYLIKHNINFKPKFIFTSGEMADQITRNKLKAYFGDIIYDIYGMTEFKEVAWECSKHEGYHINEDLYYVEIINNGKYDENDGEIVITSLANMAMPLIRFSVGDRGYKVEKPCSCGNNFSLIIPTQGRLVDYCILSDGRRISPYSLTMTLEPIQNISKYQIIQHSMTSFEIKIISSHFDSQMEFDIASRFESILGTNVVIKITPCVEIPREKSGKYRVVKCLVQR